MDAAAKETFRNALRRALGVETLEVSLDWCGAAKKRAKK
jgi:hypothetical protein